MIKLYTAETPNGQRAAIILEECGLDYKVKRLNLMKGEQRQAEFLKLNPRGQVPVVVDEEGPGGQKLVLAQSAAIMLHYATTNRVLWPEDPRTQALAMQWFMHAASDMSSLGSTIFALENFVPEKCESTIDFFIDRVEAHLTYIEGRLSEAEYLAGPLSIADMALYPNLAGRWETIDELGDFDRIHAWADALAARPAVARGMVAHEVD